MPALSASFCEKLFQAIDELKGDLVRETARLLTFETVSGCRKEDEKAKFHREIGRCLGYLKDLSERYGLIYKDLDGIVSVIEQPGREGGKGLGIPLHIDVVPASGEWKYPPFSGTVAEDTIWGRGAQDDKGPLMACLYALVALKKMGLVFLRPVHIVMGRGEEVGEWQDVQYFIKKEGAPDFSFTPDAMFPIINGEKGIMNLKVNAEWSTLDTGGALKFFSLCGGTRSNVVPDKAEILFIAGGDAKEALSDLKRELEDFQAKNPDVRYSDPELCPTGEGCPDGLKIFFHGKSAHGSLPQEGHNAILDALLFLSTHQAVSKECRTYFSFLYKACSPYYGEGLNIAREHPFVGKTTVNLGICQMNWEGGRAQVNIRPTLGFSCGDVAERAKAVVKEESEKTGVKIYVEESQEWGREPLYVDPEQNVFFISSLQEAYQTVTGRTPDLKAIGGTTFAKAYPNCVSYGPVEPAEEKEMAHMTDEHVKIAHQVRNTRIYACAIALLVTDAPSM